MTTCTFGPCNPSWRVDALVVKLCRFSANLPVWALHRRGAKRPSLRLLLPIPYEVCWISLLFWEYYTICVCVWISKCNYLYSRDGTDGFCQKQSILCFNSPPPLSLELFFVYLLVCLFVCLLACLIIQGYPPPPIYYLGALVRFGPLDALKNDGGKGGCNIIWTWGAVGS